MNMKINVLQSFMPQQIERTLLWRMHDSILRRVQELDSQQYRDQHDLDGVTGAGPVSRALTTGSMSPRGTTLALSASTTNALNGKHLGISQGLAIASQNMMVNRSFGLPPVSGGENDSITTTSSIDQSTRTELQSLNSEGINPNYVDYPTTRTLPTLQFSAATKHYAITSQPLTTSPSSTTSGGLSAFPLLNSLRPRKSHQQLTARNVGLGADLGASFNASSRPKSMYTHTSPHQQEQQQPQILQKLNNRMSRVFDFATGSKTMLDLPHSSSTLESSTLQLSSDAMMALGLEINPGSAGSVITHRNGGERVTFARGGRLGDGNLTDIKSSMAIKSSPSLTSTPLSLFSSRATSPVPGSTSNISTNSGRPSITKSSKTSFGRPVSPLPSLSAEKSSTSLPWLRLRTSSSSPVSELPQLDGYPTSSLHSGANSLSATSLLLRQPSLTESLLNAPTPPPILLDYDLDTDASLDIPSHLYYSAGGDDVDGDRPVGEDGEVSSVLGDGLGIDGESDDEDDSHSTTTRGGHSRSRASVSSKGRRSKEYRQQQQQQQQQQNLNSTDPVLKIAVLKGIYDQILQNMDHIAEHNIQESPAKKNNRFKLLNSLKFLKNQSNSSGGGSGGYSQGALSHSMGHITTTLQ